MTHPLVSAAVKIDPNKTLHDVKTWLVLVVVLALAYVAVKILFSHGEGNVKKAIGGVVVALLATMVLGLTSNPEAIGASLVALFTTGS